MISGIFLRSVKVHFVKNNSYIMKFGHFFQQKYILGEEVRSHLFFHLFFHLSYFISVLHGKRYFWNFVKTQRFDTCPKNYFTQNFVAEFNKNNV